MRFWKMYAQLAPYSVLALVWIYPFLPYQFLMLVKSPTFTSFAVLTLAISLAVVMQILFIRLGTYEATNNAMHDYLYRFKACSYIPYKLTEFVDLNIIKKVLFDFDDPNDPLTRIQILSVQPSQYNPEATKTYDPIAYTSPVGTSFIFLRDTPSNLSESSKFTLYHELGHASFNNSLERIELITRSRPYQITLLLVAISISWNIVTFILVIVQVILIFGGAPVYWHQRESSFRLRDEVRSDGFAVSLLNQEECRL